MATNFTIGMNDNKGRSKSWPKTKPAKLPSPDGGKVGQITNFQYKSLPQLMSYKGSGAVPPLNKLNLLTASRGKGTASRGKGIASGGKGNTSKGYRNK